MKKFMILLLSLAVLFSFAACDNSNSDPSGSTETTDDKTIVAITATPKEGYDKYFAGDKLDADNYVFVGTQNNGKTIEIDPSQISATYAQQSASTGFLTTTGTANDDVKDAVVANFAYVGPFQTSGTVVTTAKATVYTMSSSGVIGASTQPYYADSAANVDDVVNKDDYTVTGYATDADGTILYERELTAEEYTVTGSLASTGNVEITFTPVAAFGTVSDVIENGTNKATINVERDYVTAISIALKTGSSAPEAIIGKAAGAASDYVDVTLIYKSGKEAKDTSSAASVEWSGSTFTSTSTFTSSAQGITATYGELTDTVDVPTIANYLKSFKVTGTVDADKVIKVSDLTVAGITWADNANAETKTMTDEQVKAALRMNGAETFDTTGYEADDELPITFTIAGQPNAKATADSVVTITSI